MRLIITEPAEQDLRDMVAYIAADNPSAARAVYQKVVATAQHLADLPALGRTGQLPDTRELLVSGLPYLIVYRVHRDTIAVLAVPHTARDIAHLLKQRNENGDE